MEKNPRYVTPTGIAMYPWLNKPDTKFDPDGLYHVNLKFEKESPELEFLLKDLEKMLDDYYQAACDNPKYAKFKSKIQKADIFEEDDEGCKVLKFKQKAVIKSVKGTFNANIALFDSKGKPSKDTVGGGSQIKVCFSAIPYFVPSTKTVGLTLRPVAVQIISLQSINGSSAESYGFKSEEGGYEYTPNENDSHFEEDSLDDEGFDDDDEDSEEASRF